MHVELRKVLAKHTLPTTGRCIAAVNVIVLAGLALPQSEFVRALRITHAVSMGGTGNLLFWARQAVVHARGSGNEVVSIESWRR
jgi:hypothetical protein